MWSCRRHECFDVHRRVVEHGRRPAIAAQPCLHFHSDVAFLASQGAPHDVEAVDSTGTQGDSSMVVSVGAAAGQVQVLAELKARAGWDSQSKLVAIGP